MKKIISVLLLLVTVIFSGEYSLAQVPDSNSANNKTNPSAGGAVNTGLSANSGVLSADTSVSMFVMHAAAGSSKEIELGKMAQQKAQNRIVKDFGARMIKDHTQANAELKQLAEKKKIPMPLPGSMTDNSNKEMLMTRSGAEFDKEYMRMMVDDHQKTIALFENASSNLSDPNIKAFASKTLPILREHFDMARTIAERVGANATSGQ